MNLNQSKKTIAVAIGSQKGGVGKTTTTVMLASLLNYHTDLKVAVIDVDPQHSAIILRNREVDRMKRALESGDEAVKNEPIVKWMADLKKRGKNIFRIIPIFYHELKKKAEPIVRAELELKNKEASAAGVMLYNTPDDFEKAVSHEINVKADDLVVNTSRDIIEKGELDVIFFDFPGFIGDGKESEENIFGRLLRVMNYVFVPMDIDNNTVASTKDYLKVLLELKRKRSPNALVDFSAFMWKFSNAKNIADFIDYTEGLKEMGIKVMDAKIYDSNELKMNFSTIRPLDLPKEKSLIPFMNEFLTFVGMVDHIKVTEKSVMV